MSTDLFPRSRPWTARWIWGERDAQTTNLHRLFRLDLPAGAVRLRLAADTRYQVWVDGNFVGRGVPQSPPWLTYEQEHDLPTGGKVLAIAVYHLGDHVTGTWTQGGLIAEVLDAQSTVLAASGVSGDWWTRPDPARTRGIPPVPSQRLSPFGECVDARQMWDLRSSEGPWQSAVPVSGPWTLIVPQEAPAVTTWPLPVPACIQVEECLGVATRARNNELSISLSQAGRPLQNASVEGLDGFAAGGALTLACSQVRGYEDLEGIHDPCLLFDAGQVVNAYVEMEVDAPAGARLDIGFAERLIDGRFNNAIEVWTSACWICREGRQIVRWSDWHAFRYLRLRLSLSKRPVRILSLRLVACGYPLPPAADFASDQGDLERIRAICLRSLALCCNDGIYDTPWREAAQWLGDVALVSVPMLHLVHGDTALAGRFLRQSHRSRRELGLIGNITSCVNTNHLHRDIPDYSLWWIGALRDQWRWTGDRRWVVEHWASVIDIVDAFRPHVCDDGLIHDMPGWIFIDWAPVDKRGASAALNAMFHLALGWVEELAGVKGDADLSERARDLRQGIARSFMATFWDEECGCLIDAVHQGRRSKTLSEHSQAAAILAGLVPAPQMERIIQGVFIRPPAGLVEAEPFFMAVVLPALHKAGRVDLAMDLLRRRWGRMLAQGATSAFEEWTPNGSWRSGEYMGFQRSHSHAWSGTAAHFLITGLAGIVIAEPGGRRIRVSPWRSPYPWRVGCRIKEGQVVVTWDGRSVQIEAPPGVSVEEGSPTEQR